MFRPIKHLVLGLILSMAMPSFGVLVDPMERSTPMDTTRWSLRHTNGQTPQQDYSHIYFEAGHDILTGGPLHFGPTLSGITDITGPDWREIAAYLDSPEGLKAMPTQVARFVKHGRPPRPLGVLRPDEQPDMISLRPQHVWLIPAKRPPPPLFGRTMIGVPEVSTFTLLGLGFFAFYRQRNS